jgi:hypothetical protein
MQRLEAALHRALPQHHRRRHRPQPFELARPKILELEQTTDQSPRALAYDHPIWLGDSLQARG